MSALTSLRLLVRKMSSEEKKVARNFLTAFSLRGSGAPNRSLKLFDLLCREIRSESALDDKQIETLIYSKKSGAAFPRLILRLKDKLFESLTLSVNLERPNAYSERGRALHEIRKELSQAQILQGRGVWDWVVIILDDCIEKAAKYEHYEEWAAAIRVRIEMTTVNKGKSSFEAENQQYDKVIRSLLASKKALEYYHQLGSEIEFNAAPVSLLTLEKQIKELQQDLEKTGSANVAFFLHYLEIHYHQEKKQFKAASNILRQQAALVEFHPALYSPSRLAGVFINLAWNEIYTRRFASVLRTVDRLEQMLPQKHFNLFQVYETSFYAYFYTGKYDLALEKIDKLLKQDNSPTSEYRTGKREYLKACVLFMMEKFELVHKILVELNPIENDTEGWNIGLRTLHILNDIELEKTENAFNRIANMRKHLDKLKKASRNNPRDILIHEILRTLVSTRFDFMETRKKKAQELNDLENRDSIYAWRILSSELIIFDQWFASKVFKQSLKIRVPAYNEPVLT